MPWPAILLGWPSALGGAALLVAGVATRKTWLAAAGVLVSSGFCYYVFLNPSPLRVLGPAAFLCNVLAAVAIHRRARHLAGGLVVPYLLLAAWILGLSFGSQLR